MTVATRREWASLTPYGGDDQRTDFTPNRIAIEKIDGTVVKERVRPSEHAEGKAVDAPWDALDRAYFNGYALWTYLTTPFHFAMSDFEVEEVAPWHDDYELWRGLRVNDPPLQNGLPPNGEPKRFSPVASTLIYGSENAVLTDPAFTADQARVLGDWM